MGVQSDALGVLPPPSPWDITVGGYNSTGQFDISERPIFRTDAIGQNTSIQVTHCYARPATPGCKVGVSNTLLLCVTLCVIVKAALCIAVVTKIRDDPLVTPGDAIASFITCQDRTTQRNCMLGKQGYYKKKGVSKTVWVPATPRRRSTKQRKRIFSALPSWSWIQSYALILGALSVTSYLFNMALQTWPIDLHKSVALRQTGAIFTNLC